MRVAGSLGGGSSKSRSGSREELGSGNKSTLKKIYRSRFCLRANIVD